MTHVTEERWYRDPFGWYEEQNHPELYGIQMTNTVALDFLAGLYDIYTSFKKHNVEKAIRHSEILATLLIASATNVGSEVIEELISEEFNEMDFDKAISNLIEGMDDNG